MSKSVGPVGKIAVSPGRGDSELHFDIPRGGTKESHDVVAEVGVIAPFGALIDGHIHDDSEVAEDDKPSGSVSDEANEDDKIEECTDVRTEVTKLVSQRQKTTP